MKQAAHLKKNNNNTFLNLLLIVFIIIFLFSSYKVIMYFVDANNNKKLNNVLIEKAVVSSAEEDINENQSEIENNTNKPFDVDFTVLKQENDDIVGWIYSENTPINFPILQSNDNNYYLRRLYTGKYNTAGSIFVDYRNKSDFTDKVTIIYGHNMKNDTMFGTLQNYEISGYYDNHKIMYLYTPEKNYIIRVFAGLSILADSDIYNIPNTNKNLVYNLSSESDFKTDVEVNENSNIVILSTCAYEYQGARYIVAGVLEEL